VRRQILSVLMERPSRWESRDVLILDALGDGLRQQAFDAKIPTFDTILLLSFQGALREGDVAGWRFGYAPA
jgi:hypothetical protein